MQFFFFFAKVRITDAKLISSGYTVNFMTYGMVWTFVNPTLLPLPLFALQNKILQIKQNPCLLCTVWSIVDSNNKATYYFFIRKEILITTYTLHTCLPFLHLYSHLGIYMCVCVLQIVNGIIYVEIIIAIT